MFLLNVLCYIVILVLVVDAIVYIRNLRMFSYTIRRATYSLEYLYRNVDCEDLVRVASESWCDMRSTALGSCRPPVVRTVIALALMAGTDSGVLSDLLLYSLILSVGVLIFSRIKLGSLVKIADSKCVKL